MERSDKMRCNSNSKAISRLFYVILVHCETVAVSLTVAKNKLDLSGIVHLWNIYVHFSTNPKNLSFAIWKGFLQMYFLKSP